MAQISGRSIWLPVSAKLRSAKCCSPEARNNSPPAKALTGSRPSTRPRKVIPIWRESFSGSILNTITYKIEISLRNQKLIVYRDEAPFLTARISTGREDKPTPPGNYLVTDKIRLERSTLYKVRMPFFLRLSFSEFGIHYGVNPGHPASHGCIRVGSEEMAQKIFESCPIGTLVHE